MISAVHLDGVRCDGSAHGGCQAGCLMFWKDAWLKKADAPAADGRAAAPGAQQSVPRGISEGEKAVGAGTRQPGRPADGEMVPFCGGPYRVLQRVNRIIDEKTGRMMHMKNECIQLDGVTCQACYAKYRKFCPRSIFPYWREIWLRRADSDAAGTA